MFDEARVVVVVDVLEGRAVDRREVPIGPAEPVGRARSIAALGIEVLICGAISRQLEALLSSVRVLVIPNTCGPIEPVLAAFVTRRMNERDFLMPGCRGGRRLRARRRHGQRARGR